MEENQHFEFQGMCIAQWVRNLEGETVTVQKYAQQLRGTMYGGSLEIHVIAHLYQAQFQVFILHRNEYNLVHSTEVNCHLQGWQFSF